jgi:hypothetical protein
MDHRFYFIQHAVNDDRKFRKRLVHGTVRQPLAEVGGDDALNPLIDSPRPASARTHTTKTA